MGCPAKSYRLPLVSLLLCAGLALSCSDNAVMPMPMPIAPKVVVELKGAVADVASWNVQVDLDNRPAQQQINLDGSVTRFALELDAGVQGKLTVGVRGTASFPFIISKGSNFTEVGAADVVNLAIDTKQTQVCTKEGWCWERPYPSGRAINALWAATDSSEVWAVGGAGLLLHYDGKAWDLVNSGTDEDMLSVFGLSSREVYFGGSTPAGPLLLRWDGTSVTPVTIPNKTLKSAVVAIWASKSNDLWCAVQARDPVFAIASQAVLYRWDGSDWSSIPQSDWGIQNNTIIGAMGGATTGHPWIFGFQEQPGMTFLVNKDDAKWNNYSSMLAAAIPATTRTSMVVKSDSDVWLAYQRKVLHFDGSSLSDLQADRITAPCDWAALAVASPTDIWAAPMKGGACSTQLWRYNGSTWSSIADADLPTVPDGGGYLTIAATSQTVWAAGNLGALRQYDRSRSQPLWIPHLPERIADIDAKYGLQGISGTSPKDLWAVGNQTWLHSDGSRWTDVDWKKIDPSGSGGFTAVSVADAENVWVIDAGSTDPLRYDGTGWTTVKTGGTQSLNAVWASKNSGVWVAGAQLQVYRLDGNSWSNVTPTNLTQPIQNQGKLGRYNVYDMWGVEGQAVWVLGGITDGLPDQGPVFWQYDLGTKIWTDLTGVMLAGVMKPATAYPPSNIWASGKDNIWLGGDAWRPSISFTNNVWSLASWCLPDGQTGADADSGALIWGSAPDSIWCFGRHRNYARGGASGATSSGFFGGSDYNVINRAWSASPEEVWIVGDQGVILHRKPPG